MVILKTAECPSLSGQSTLTYNIGLNDKKLCICLTGNTGAGVINKMPVELAQIQTLLASQKGPITSGCLLGLFEGKSSNSAGFLLAVLLAEGLVKVSFDNQRQYERVNEKAYEKIVQAYAKKKSGKKRKNG